MPITTALTTVNMYCVLLQCVSWDMSQMDQEDVNPVKKIGSGKNYLLQAAPLVLH